MMHITKMCLVLSAQWMINNGLLFYYLHCYSYVFNYQSQHVKAALQTPEDYLLSTFPKQTLYFHYFNLLFQFIYLKLFKYKFTVLKLLGIGLQFDFTYR